MSEATPTGIAPTMEAQPDPVALFVSDVHLHESLPATTNAFLDFLRKHAVKAQQLYLLGDLFEYWAGDDDVATPYHRQIADALREVSASGVLLFWIAGNRDFLVGEGFAKAAGASLLAEPHVAVIGERSVTLVHGDAQCTDDAAYMAFRGQVRDLQWQQTFLAMPLAQRKSIIEGMRDQSRAAQRAKSYDIMDVNDEAIMALFKVTGTSVIIHGHTHRPARHEYRKGGVLLERYVLPDWDCDTQPARGGWLAMMADGVIKRYEWNGQEI